MLVSIGPFYFFPLFAVASPGDKRQAGFDWQNKRTYIQTYSKLIFTAKVVGKGTSVGKFHLLLKRNTMLSIP